MKIHFLFIFWYQTNSLTNHIDDSHNPFDLADAILNFNFKKWKKDTNFARNCKSFHDSAFKIVSHNIIKRTTFSLEQGSAAGNEHRCAGENA